jgi:RNA ligase
MLHISNIDEFRSHVAHKEEIREMDIGFDSISFCYMVAAEKTFDDAWALECRGIVFDKVSGRVSGRPLHKFFNVGERESTLPENLDWSKVVRVMDKRDGSLIHTVQTAHGVRLKSKKTFSSAVALAAEKWMREQPGQHVLSFANFVTAQNLTAIFEWTAPDARIVLFYPEAELRLLHIRHNETGDYVAGNILKEWAEKFNVNVVDEVDEFFEAQGSQTTFNHRKMLEAAKTREGIEGWVVQFENGDMVKVKTDWYLKRHHAMTFLRERDIAQLVLDESLDDMKSLLVSEGVNINEILEIEERVLHDLREIALTVDMIYSEDKNLPRKDFAIKHSSHKYFGMLMAKYSGKEPSFKDYFARNVLKNNYSLRQLVLVPSVAEGD